MYTLTCAVSYLLAIYIGISTVSGQCEENGFCPVIDCTGQPSESYICDETIAQGSDCVEHPTLCDACARACELGALLQATANTAYSAMSCTNGTCYVAPGSPTAAPTDPHLCTAYNCTLSPTTRCDSQTPAPHHCDVSSFAPTSPCTNQPDECSACCDAYDINKNDFGDLFSMAQVYDSYCRTGNCPTPAPTNIPSDIPTRNPTTRAPTTGVPTAAPTTGTPTTTAPTTGEPTGAPTTGAPTTKAPTRSPLDPGQTHEPTTDIPTRIPTEIPTDSPSVLPTTYPTVDPTTQPTEMPTVDPTVDPTGQPSEIPTDSPSVLPTTQPTEIPTVDPTGQPSTTDPTTSTPTTSIPTTGPTTDPTGYPTTPEPTGGVADGDGAVMIHLFRSVVLILIVQLFM